MKYLLLTLLLISCSAEVSIRDDKEKNKTESIFKMNCEKVSENIAMARCENPEAICYKGYWSDSGVYCKFKETKKPQDKSSIGHEFFIMEEK